MTRSLASRLLLMDHVRIEEQGSDGSGVVSISEIKIPQRSPSREIHCAPGRSYENTVAVSSGKRDYYRIVSNLSSMIVFPSFTDGSRSRCRKSFEGLQSVKRET